MNRFFVGPLALCLCLASQVHGQVRLNLFGGYTFQDRFTAAGTYNGYSYTEGVISDGTHFGGGLEFEIRPHTALELFYQTQKADGFVRTTYLDYGPYEVNVSYIMLGGLHYAPFNPKISGYGGFNLGMAIFGGDVSASKFAIGGKLGLMLNASETVGIKLGAQILSAVQGAGGGFYFGTGGASAGVSTYSSIYQFGFTGGLSFAFGGSGRRPPPAPTSAPPPPPPPPSH